MDQIFSLLKIRSHSRKGPPLGECGHGAARRGRVARTEIGVARTDSYVRVLRERVVLGLTGRARGTIARSTE